MKFYNLGDDTIAKDEEIALAFDAHDKTLDATALGEDGEPVYRETILHDRAHVEALVERFPECEIVATYESGPTGYQLLYWLQQLGCEAFITPSTKVKEDKGGKQIKTDRRDSMELAEQLHAGMLKQVHDHGRGHYRQRELTRTRQQLVEHRSAVCNQLKSKMKYHGLEAPESISTRWSNDFIEWLDEQPSGDRWLDASLGALTETYRDLSDQIEGLEEELEKLAPCEDEEVDEQLGDEESFQFEGWAELLQTVPGIGLLSAMVLILELGNILRFDTAEQFASYLGLVPGEWSSGQTQSKRAMVRWGNKRARTVLVEASWTLIDKDARMRRVYERIKARSGSGQAICAVARRLGLAIRAMLRDGKAYECNHPSMSRQALEEADNQTSCVPEEQAGRTDGNRDEH